MASYAYGISQVNLDPQKRTFTVTASKKIAKAGDIIKFTVTASKKGASWGFDRTVRPWKLSPNFGPEDIAGGKTNGLLYFKPGGASGSASGLTAEVEIAISEDYIADKDKVLRFTVIEDTSALLRISAGAYADVLVRGNDGEDEIQKIRNKLKGEDRRKLTQSKDGKIVKQDPIEKVRVREIGKRTLPGGPKSLPGPASKLLPPAMNPLTGANPAALLPPAVSPVPGATPKVLPTPPKTLALPASQQVIDVTPTSVSRSSGSLIGTRDVPNMKQVSAKYGLDVPAPKPAWGPSASGGSIAKSVGGGAKMLSRASGPAQALFAGMEFQDRMASGQNLVQAGLGSAASAGGGIAGASAGAAAGAAIGSIVPGIGTAIGGVIGGILGGMGGSAVAGGATDALTGAGQSSVEPVPFREGGTIIPGMENMPFNVGGMPGVFNEPGNPEVMSIQPLDKIKDSFDNFKDLFGGKPKEYKGLADAIADAMEDRGIGDPFGLKGGKGRTFGNMTSDLAKHTMKGLKEIFGGGNNQGQSGGGAEGGGGSGGGGGGITSDSPPSVGGGAGKTTANEVYSYLKQKGVSDVHARGIVANVSRESGFKIGAHNPNDPNGGSIGLFQWNAGRASRMTSTVPNWQTNWKGQIDYALQEDYGPTYLSKSYASAGQAAYDFMNKWERPADYVRAKYTPEVYDAMIAKMNLQSGAVAMGPSGGGAAPGPQQPASGGTQMSPLFRSAGPSGSAPSLGGGPSSGFQQVSYTPPSGGAGAAQPTMQRSGMSMSALPPLPPTDTLGGGVQRYGASRDNGSRKHAGVDFDISGNQQFYSRIGGVVVGQPFRYGADGWAIDIHNQQMGVYERIAEAQKILVKPGQVVQPGQPVVQGESGTGVIHYEIRKKIEGGFENSMDPIAFLNGTGSNPTMLAQGPGSAGGGGGETVDPDAPTAADAEAFFKFAGEAQGLEMASATPSAPNMSAPASAGTQPNQLLTTSAQTTMASQAPGPVIVNAPTTSVSSSADAGGSDGSSQQPGSTMSDSGLLAFVAHQQLMTLGA